MKAVVYSRYGSPDVLSVEDVPTPTPGDDEVLVRVHAVSINGADRENLIGKPLYARISGPRHPRQPILGSDIAGRVEQVGRNVDAFKPGDEVCGEIPGYHGGFAEYACTTAPMLVPKPTNLTFEQASAIPQAGAIAVAAIHDRGDVHPGQRVLINGAGGSAGTFALLLAKARGAEVTAVDNGHKAGFLAEIGADHVVDYTSVDPTRTGASYDLILDLWAHRAPFRWTRALADGGTYYVVGGVVRALLGCVVVGPVIGRLTNKRLRMLIVPQGGKHLRSIAELCAKGSVTPVIDRAFPLDEAADAMRYVASGQQRGKVVLTVA